MAQDNSKGAAVNKSDGHDLTMYHTPPAAPGSVAQEDAGVDELRTDNSNMHYMQQMAVECLAQVVVEDPCVIPGGMGFWHYQHMQSMPVDSVAPPVLVDDACINPVGISQWEQQIAQQTSAAGVTQVTADGMSTNPVGTGYSDKQPVVFEGCHVH